MRYAKFSAEELEVTRHGMWQDYLPLLYDFLELKDGQKILDVGCGSGAYTRLLAARVKGQIIGADIDDEVLKAARKLGKAYGIQFVKHDVYALGFPDDYFDLVTCQMLLSNLEKPARALREMIRVTKSRGLVAAIEPYNSGVISYLGEEPELAELANLLHRAMDGREADIKALGGDLSIGPKLPTLFYRAGLRDVDVRGYLMVNFAGRFGQKRTAYELNRVKESVERGWLSQASYERILELFRSSKPNPGAIQALPLFITKGRKA